MIEAGPELVSSVSASVPSGELFSSADTPLRLTLIQSGQKSANKRDEWELPALGSCITCSSGTEQPGSESYVQLHLPRKGEYTDLDAPHDHRYIHKTQLKHVLSDTEVISFINVNDVLEAIEFVDMVDVPGREGQSVLLIVSCRTSSNDNHSSSRILIYELLVKSFMDVEECCSDPRISVDIYNPRLVRICVLQDDVCVGIHWINGMNYGYPVREVDDLDLLVFLRMEAGSVMLCKLKYCTLGEAYGPPDLIITNMCDMFHVIWYFNPSKNIKGEKVTCTSITYRTVEEDVPFREGSPEAIKFANVAQDDFAPTHSTINIAGGTNDGFLYIWKFYWNVMCKASGSNYKDVSTNPISPYFFMMIPLFPPFPQQSMSRCLVSVSFMPAPEAYIVAIVTYSGLVIIWDIRHGILEGELKTYHNTHRPLTSVTWTGDLQHLLIGGASAMFVDWRSDSPISALPYDRWPRVKYEGTFDNTCWAIGATDKYANFCYDDGLFVHIPLFALNRRDAQDLGTTFLWEPTIKDGNDQVADDDDLASEDIVLKVYELSTRQFQMDLTSIRKNGICITRNGSKYRGGRIGKKRDMRLIRNKVFAHHCTRAHTARFTGFSLSFVAYGGNAGVVQLLIKH